MVQHVILSLVQLLHPAFIWMVIRAVFVTLVLLAGAVTLALFGIEPLFPDAVDTLGTLAAFGLTSVIAVFLFIPISAIVVAMFVEEAATRVEKGYYPDRLGTRDQPAWEGIQVGLRLAMKLLFANLLILIVSIFVPVVWIFGFNIIVFVLVNGYFAGREYFEMVALRHYPAADVSTLRKTARFKVWTAGVIIALGLIVPVFNFFAPLFGAAFMVHVFQDVDARASR